MLTPGWVAVGTILTPGWVAVGTILIPGWVTVGTILTPGWVAVGTILTPWVGPRCVTHLRFRRGGGNSWVAMTATPGVN